MLTSCCCKACDIFSDSFEKNDGNPHAGWTARDAIRGTAAADRATNTGGTFNFPAPGVQLVNAAHPLGSFTEQHAKVRAQLSELFSGGGAAADVFLGYTDDDGVVYVRVVKNPTTITPGSTTSSFYGSRHDFALVPGGHLGDFWTCPEGVSSLTASCAAKGRDGGTGAGGTPNGGEGGGGGAYSKGTVTVIPGVKYQIGSLSNDVYVSDPFGGSELVYAEDGGRHGALADIHLGGRASACIGDVKSSGGDGGTGTAPGGGGGGGAAIGTNGANAAGQIAGATVIAGGDGGNVGVPTGVNGNDTLDKDNGGGGGGGGSGSVTGGTGGKGGTGNVKLEYTSAAQSSCAHIEFRIRDSRGDYEIPGAPRVALEFLSDSEWITIEVCLIEGPTDYGNTMWKLRAMVTTAARSYPFCGQANIRGDLGFNPGSKAALGAGKGSVKFDDYHFTYLKQDPDHKECPNCNSGCLIGEGVFNPNHVKDSFGYLTCFWHVLAGNASMTSGYLQLENGSLVQYMLPHPTNKESRIVTVDLVWDANVSLSISLGSSYVYFNSNSQDIYILPVLGDTATSGIGSLPAPDGLVHRVKVCEVDGVITATFDNMTHCLNATGTFGVADDPFVYLGSALGTVKVLSFKYEKAYNLDEPSDKDCERCESCSPPCKRCDPGSKFVIAIINNNLFTDDTFDVSLNGVAIGTVTNGGPHFPNCVVLQCTGRLFAEDAAIATWAGLPCPAGLNLDATALLDMTLLRTGVNELKLLSTTGPTGCANGGAVMVLCVKPDGAGGWTQDTECLFAAYTFDDGPNTGQAYLFNLE